MWRLQFFLSILPLINTAICPACPTGGIWSEWTAVGTCATTCGACSTQNYTRTCLSDALKDCKCSGPTTTTQLCGTQACNYPRVNGPKPPCCTGTPTVINNWYHCVNSSTSQTRGSTFCCPTGGIWGDWSAWAKKDEKSVEFTRTRSCLTGGLNCVCDGEIEETKYACPCGPLKTITPENNPCASKTTKTPYAIRDPAYFPSTCDATVMLANSNFRQPFYTFNEEKKKYTCTTGFVNQSGQCQIGEFPTGDTDTSGQFWRFTFNCNLETGAWDRKFDEYDMKGITHIAQFYAKTD
ncbi:Protein CBG18745 [Caenorhabditis briggsae]|uniref:Protein CBG18745 n=2 Tax=Caenorhabditis briggsae TaxID=6238 RepID=A8XU13_CAEBR|nr:Protein CBG18745 [Caenorhabditis briggsae]ULT93590.1 hypothetical protein L3Y34_003232 [Caenorhabditis briggsae]CAP36140.1 Protein CBG18745 [Caenorhabditis briggsae]